MSTSGRVSNLPRAKTNGSLRSHKIRSRGPTVPGIVTISRRERRSPDSTSGRPITTCYQSTTAIPSTTPHRVEPSAPSRFRYPAPRAVTSRDEIKDGRDDGRKFGRGSDSRSRHLQCSLAGPSRLFLRFFGQIFCGLLRLVLRVTAEGESYTAYQNVHIRLAELFRAIFCRILVQRFQTGKMLTAAASIIACRLPSCSQIKHSEKKLYHTLLVLSPSANELYHPRNLGCQLERSQALHKKSPTRRHAHILFINELFCQMGRCTPIKHH